MANHARVHGIIASSSPFDFFSASILVPLKFPTMNPSLDLTNGSIQRKVAHDCQFLHKVGHYLSTTEDPDRERSWVTLAGSEKLKRDLLS